VIDAIEPTICKHAAIAHVQFATAIACETLEAMSQLRSFSFIIQIAFLFPYNSSLSLTLKALRSFSLKGLSSLNSTMGHSDSMAAFGMHECDDFKTNVVKFNHTTAVFNENADKINEDEVDDVARVIPIEELKQALEQAVLLSSQSDSEIKKSGWNVVHIDDTFSLYKRRVTVPGRDGPGPVEYLMLGCFEDVSPRVFLYSQIDRMCRVVWDKTMGDMSDAQLTTHNHQQQHRRGNSSRCVEEDTLYYRTRWPWPLKDRDYVLARRCKVFDSKDAIVLISKSVEDANYARKDGVIRVDNYWCKSAFISTLERQQSDGEGGSAAMDSDQLRSVGCAVTSVIDKLHLHYQRTDRPVGPMLLTALERHRPKLQIKRRMLRRLHDAMKLERQLKLRPPVGLYFHRNYMSSSCNSVDNLDFVSINGRADATQYNAIGRDRGRPTCDPKRNIKRISSDPSVPSDESTSKKYHDRSAPRNIDRPGMKFVTIFCDDQKVPLPAAVTDILSKQGEKVVPGSISRLHEVAKELQDKGLP